MTQALTKPCAEGGSSFGCNVFLLCVRTTLDELPIGLHDTLDDARTAAGLIDQKQVDRAVDLMRVDNDDVVNCCIIGFAMGVPTYMQILDLPASFDEEDDEAGK